MRAALFEMQSGGQVSLRTEAVAVVVKPSLLGTCETSGARGCAAAGFLRKTSRRSLVPNQQGGCRCIGPNRSNSLPWNRARGSPQESLVRTGKSVYAHIAHHDHRQEIQGVRGKNFLVPHECVARERANVLRNNFGRVAKADALGYLAVAPGFQIWSRRGRRQSAQARKFSNPTIGRETCGSCRT